VMYIKGTHHSIASVSDTSWRDSFMNTCCNIMLSSRKLYFKLRLRKSQTQDPTRYEGYLNEKPRLHNQDVI
jgi:hypothetical protein